MKKQKYDERQLMIQNNVYRYSFVILIILELINVTLNNFRIVWATNGLFSYCIVVLIVATPGVYIMIFKEAYLTNFKSKIIVFLFFGITAIILFINFIYRLLFIGYKIIINNSLTVTGSTLICAILFLIFGSSGVLKLLYDKVNKNENEIDKLEDLKSEQ